MSCRILSFGLLLAGFAIGHYQASQAAAADRAALQTLTYAAQARATTLARQVDSRYLTTLADLAATHAKDTAHAQAGQQARADLLRAGTLRVSVPAASCSVPGPSADPAAGPAAPRAELAPQTAIDLDALATDGDLAIIDLNRCLAAHEAARAAVSDYAAALQGDKP